MRLPTIPDWLPPWTYVFVCAATLLVVVLWVVFPPDNVGHRLDADVERLCTTIAVVQVDVPPVVLDAAREACP